MFVTCHQHSCGKSIHDHGHLEDGQLSAPGNTEARYGAHNEHYELQHMLVHSLQHNSRGQGCHKKRKRPAVKKEIERQKE